MFWRPPFSVTLPQHPPTSPSGQSDRWTQVFSIWRLGRPGSGPRPTTSGTPVARYLSKGTNGTMALKEEPEAGIRIPSVVKWLGGVTDVKAHCDEC